MARNWGNGRAWPRRGCVTGPPGRAALTGVRHGGLRAAVGRKEQRLRAQRVRVQVAVFPSAAAGDASWGGCLKPAAC